MVGGFTDKKGFRREETLDEYTNLGDCVIEKLSAKQALIKIGEQPRVWIPYSLMHEEDMVKIDVGVRLNKLRVQAWFVRRKKLIT